MDKPLNALPTISPRLRRIVVRTLIGGFGFGVGVGLIVLAVMFYSERPKGWDTKSLRGSNVKAGSLSKLDRDPVLKQTDEERWITSSTGSIFAVDLQNTTGKDIVLPTSVTIMQAAKGTGALHGSFLKLSKDYFVPAHNTVTITIENDGECTPTVKVEDCFNSYFKDDSDIVLFDQNQKYEIRFPIPPLTPGDPYVNPPATLPANFSGFDEDTQKSSTGSAPQTKRPAR